MKLIITFLTLLLFCNVFGQTNYGGIDSTFNPNDTGFGKHLGIRNLNQRGVTDIHIDGNNKITLCGEFSNFNGFEKQQIVRLNSDLTVDQNFESDFNPYFVQWSWYPFSMGIQPSGKIVLVGNFISLMSGNIIDRRIARIDTNGFRDNS